MNNWTATISNGYSTEDKEEHTLWEALFQVAYALDNQRALNTPYYWRGLVGVEKYETDRHNNNGVTVYVRKIH